MNYTGSMILFIFLVQLAAYTLKWLIGFGNPLISAPLLAMRLDNTLITPGSLLPDLVINGRITWQSRNNFRWRAILPLLLAMVAGVVPGTWLLRFSLPWIIKTVLGGVVVFLGLEMATRRLRPVRPDRREIPWLRYLVAFFSGMCALNGRSCLYCTEGYVTENRCFGPEETAAVRLAQQRAGLLVTGTVDRGTWAALQAQSCPHCSKEE